MGEGGENFGDGENHAGSQWDSENDGIVFWNYNYTRALEESSAVNP